MTARVALLVGAIAVVQTQQTFRTTTDVVMVDVSVRSGDRAVTNLTASDFVLTDNGARQKIESVEAAAVPVDVTLVVDMSGNYRRPKAARINRAKIVADLEGEVRSVAKILRPADRMRLLTIDGYVRQVWPFLPVAELPRLTDVELDGLASVYEGLAAALLYPVEPARRHVVVARTKGIDTISAISARAVGAIATKSDALFHLVIMDEAVIQEDATSGFQARNGFIWPTRRFWVPFVRRAVGPLPSYGVSGPSGPGLYPDGLALKAGAEATGGAVHQTAMITVPSLTGTFRAAFEDFRSSYVLRYTPQSVTRGGWHSIAVTVPGAKGATVRARKGYGIDEAAPAPVVPPASAVPRTLDELTAAYERGAFQNVVFGLQRVSDHARLLRDFNEAGNPWPGAPRREAAFAIELAEAALFSQGQDARKEAQDLLTKFTRLIRHPLAPDDFERQWYVTVLMLLQGAIRPGLAQPFVDRALARFPSDPAFLLARAIVAEQNFRSGGAKFAPPYEEVLRRYEAAIALPEVATEARIRLAMRLHLSKRSTQALALLEAAGAQPIQAPNLAYLRQLFLGHVLGALGRTDEAMAAYRQALEIVPPGQAARVALMGRLLERGNKSEAEALADLVETERSPALDPWWLYWQGQYRLYPQAIAELRQLTTRN